MSIPCRLCKKRHRLTRTLKSERCCEITRTYNYYIYWECSFVLSYITGCIILRLLFNSQRYEKAKGRQLAVSLRRDLSFVVAVHSSNIFECFKYWSLLIRRRTWYLVRLRVCASNASNGAAPPRSYNTTFPIVLLWPSMTRCRSCL